MSQTPDDASRRPNIHAPWRIEYIRSLAGKEDGCFLCRAYEQTDRDEENLLLWRTPECMVVLNRFPYTAGHLLIAPADHVGSLGGLSAQTMRQLMELTRDCIELLGHSIRAEGYNVGMNLGRCAGAGLPDHVHLHVVPRWSGDTNFMAVLGDVRVIPQCLKDLRRQLLRAGRERNLPEACYAR